jgi:hypothetical protein
MKGEKKGKIRCDAYRSSDKERAELPLIKFLLYLDNVMLIA